MVICCFITNMSGKSRYFTNQKPASFTRVLRSGTRRKHITVEYEETQVKNVSKKDSKPGKRARNEPTSSTTSSSWFPVNWREQLDNICQMRASRTAAVDTQGCEKTADLKATPSIQRYQILISLMLSSQTKDQVTFEAMRKLKANNLCIDHVLTMTEDEIGELIKPVGFWKKKANYIKRATDICHQQYNNDIPSTVEDLIQLPGVGPKMAYITMSAAWNKLCGIGVDTHVHRISNRLGWVKKPTSNPEQTRVALESWLPKEEWNEVNILLVGFGQQTCLPVKPKCNTCLNVSICPYAKSNNSKK